MLSAPCFSENYVSRALHDEGYRGDIMKDLFDKLFSGGFASTYFTDPFKGFSWWDALDILALALIFFALYLFVRDRRAGKLMAGIVLLFGIYALSELLNMHALQYIFGSFFATAS